MNTCPAQALDLYNYNDGFRVLLSQNHRNPLYLEDDKSVCNLRSIGWADLRYNPNVKFTRKNVRMLTKDLLKEPTERDRSVAMVGVCSYVTRLCHILRWQSITATCSTGGGTIPTL